MHRIHCRLPDSAFCRVISDSTIWTATPSPRPLLRNPASSSIKILKNLYATDIHRGPESSASPTFTDSHHGHCERRVLEGGLVVKVASTHDGTTLRILAFRTLQPAITSPINRTHCQHSPPIFSPKLENHTAVFNSNLNVQLAYQPALPTVAKLKFRVSQVS